MLTFINKHIFYIQKIKVLTYDQLSPIFSKNKLKTN